MKKNINLYAGVALIIVGLAGLVIASSFMNSYPTGGFGPVPGGRQFDTQTMMNFMMRDFSKSSYSSNGERLFLIGENESGRRITSNMGNMTMMRSFSCANCHGADGRGGLRFPDGVKSANITWPSLTKGEEKEGNPPYNERLFKRAVTEGIDTAGKPLSSFMPRWQIDDNDLNDLVGYLKKLK